MKLSFTDEKCMTDGGAVWLCLKVTDPIAARRFCIEQTKSVIFDAEIREHREKRSLEANAYAWVLIGKLAEATRIPVIEVYRNAIRDIGGNYDVVCVAQKAADTLERHWRTKGDGWVVERFDSKIPGCVNMRLYYGSSVYDTRQMSRLIDNIVEDCRALGIETLTPEKLAAMKEGWNAQTDKGDHDTDIR